VNVPHYARWAARLLARHEPPVPPTGASRVRGIATIERALAARRPRRRVAAIASVAAIAAGLFAWVALTRLEARAPVVSDGESVSVLVSPIREGALLRNSTGELPLEMITSLPRGGRIATKPGGGAALQLSTGTRVELGSASLLTLESQGALQLFALQQGLLDAHVAKLGSGQRFVVDTPDAQVEVRGTVFHLEVLAEPEPCGSGARTRLDVREGVVEVRTGSGVIRVGAGERWPSDCKSATAAEQPAAPSASAPETTAARAAPLKPVLPAGGARSVQRSLLAAQNDAFRAAVQAQDSADSAAALGAYARFIRRYPASPLAENAYVERLRLLAASDSARAKVEAARYLQRYPNGFAREEAERIEAAH
jgi:hypothetical protein